MAVPEKSLGKNVGTDHKLHTHSIRDTLRQYQKKHRHVDLRALKKWSGYGLARSWRVFSIFIVMTPQ
ncbi:hypothetical protein CCACVL1_06882 [Corchorus capsularis]|uniref:Uncharacterized protein n=1 Tax=Corchorus capsularis TaxID=210143 RepID=A0A1R3JBZ5_COCAP|nr:hypothetical protein CCACVL1_06882 [Corchorus capsularis]